MSASLCVHVLLLYNKKTGLNSYFSPVFYILNISKSKSSTTFKQYIRVNLPHYLLLNSLQTIAVATATFKDSLVNSPTG